MLNLRAIPYIIFGLFLILSLYFTYFHYEGVSYSSSSVGGYILLLFIFFSGYKYIQGVNGIKKYQVTPLLLLGVFFAHLLVLCMYFVGLSGQNFLLGTTLWFFLGFKILAISFLWYCIYLFGRRLIDISQVFQEGTSSAILRITSLVIGFFLLSVSLFLMAALGWYNIYGFIALLSIILIVIFPHLKEISTYLKTPLAEGELKTDRGYVSTFINEIHYIILTLFLGVNLISAYRPFPIGWDDLGAYMNYPKLISGSEGLISMGNMYAFELYTGIGYIFGSQSSAFLLSSFSGVIAAIVLFYTLSLFKKDKDEPVFSYALLATLIMMILPMTVFQLAKDMKLDYGLLFVSLGALALSYYLLYSESKLSHNWKLWCIVGLFIGFAFTIKITSVLLLFALIGLIVYRYGGVSLYFASFFAIVGLLSTGGLWSMLNVVFPQDSDVALIFASVSFLLAGGLIFITYLVHKNIDPLVYSLKNIAAIVLGCVIAFLPWGIKNTFETLEAGKSINVGTLISGESERLRLDPTLIYTQEEIGVMEAQNTSGLSEEGITTNEDFGRYFGYELGINNYLKLPWNLTFQVNQGGEFTQITFIFFLLLPLVFFVFPLKTILYYITPIIAIIITLLYFVPNPVSEFLTSLIGNIGLPFGYIIIALFYFSAFLYASLSFKREQGGYSESFLAILAFTSMYVFFWAISAYGIVWYGIVMYVGFLALIVLGLHQAEREKYVYVPYLALFGVWIYILLTGFSHATNNLKNAGHLDFKLGQITEYQALMQSHPDYFEFLFAFNLTAVGQEKVLREARRSFIEVFQQYEVFAQLSPYIAEADTPESLHNLIRALDREDMPRSLEREYSQVKQELYVQVINPSDDIKSTENIYRIGTFMTYFMVDNHTRVLFDNLINTFDTYIWNKDPSIVTQRLQGLDMRYLIFDLNAATIDEDPRQDLTRRYENLLKYALSFEVEYVAADSICFRLARDFYNAGDITLESALSIAGINYGTPEERSNRLRDCTLTIYEAIQQGAYNDERFTYLNVYRNHLENIVRLLQENNIEITVQEVIQRLARVVPRGYKVLLRIPD